MKSLYITKKESYIFILSLVAFTCSAYGIFEGITNSIFSFLYNNLGYIETKGNAFVPLWFYDMNVNISTIFGRELYVLFGLFLLFHYAIIKNYFDLTWFSFSYIWAIFLLLAFKLIFQGLEPTKFFNISIISGGHFPSGHAILSIIMSFHFYWAVAKRNRDKAYHSFVAYFMLFLILINSSSRIFLGRHTVDEIIGGWSLAVIWSLFSLFIYNLLQKKFI